MKVNFLILLSWHIVLASAQQINLGSAATFAVLGAAAITNNGLSLINGDIGTGGTSITGFAQGTVTGNEYIAAQAITPLRDATAAFNSISILSGVDLTGQDLGGMSLGPGTYQFASTAQLTGALTLLGGTNPGATWVFQIGTALLTAAGSSVVLSGSARACNVYWQVGSSATVGAGTSFVGAVLAGASITLFAASSSNGGLFALGGQVTLEMNRVQVASCPASSSSVSSISTGGGGVVASSSSSVALASTSIGGGGGGIRSSSSSLEVSSSTAGGAGGAISSSSSIVTLSATSILGGGGGGLLSSTTVSIGGSSFTATPLGTSTSVSASSSITTSTIILLSQSGSSLSSFLSSPSSSSLTTSPSSFSGTTSSSHMSMTIETTSLTVAQISSSSTGIGSSSSTSSSASATISFIPSSQATSLPSLGISGSVSSDLTSSISSLASSTPSFSSSQASSSQASSILSLSFTDQSKSSATSLGLLMTTSSASTSTTSCPFIVPPTITTTIYQITCPTLVSDLRVSTATATQAGYESKTIETIFRGVSTRTITQSSLCSTKTYTSHFSRISISTDQTETESLRITVTESYTETLISTKILPSFGFSQNCSAAVASTVYLTIEGRQFPTLGQPVYPTSHGGVEEYGEYTGPTLTTSCTLQHYPATSCTLPHYPAESTLWQGEVGDLAIDAGSRTMIPTATCTLQHLLTAKASEVADVTESTCSWIRQCATPILDAWEEQISTATMNWQSEETNQMTPAERLAGEERPTGMSGGAASMAVDSANDSVEQIPSKSMPGVGGMVVHSQGMQDDGSTVYWPAGTATTSCQSQGTSQMAAGEAIESEGASENLWAAPGSRVVESSKGKPSPVQISTQDSGDTAISNQGVRTLWFDVALRYIWSLIFSHIIL